MRAKQPVTVANIEFDALIQETRTLEAEVPEYPVESGFSVSDSIIVKPEVLELVLFVTDMPVTWYRRHGSSRGRVEQVCKQLENLYFAGEPVTVITSERTYTNMAIESISFEKTTEIGYAREIPVTFKKVRVTSTQTTTIPDTYGKSGATGANGGTANTEAGTTGGSSDNPGSEETSRSSILYNAAKSFGLL